MILMPFENLTSLTAASEKMASKVSLFRFTYYSKSRMWLLAQSAHYSDSQGHLTENGITFFSKKCAHTEIYIQCQFCGLK